MRKKQLDIDEITGEAIEAKVYRFILPYLRPHLWPVLSALGLILFAVAVSLYSPRILGRIVDHALIPKQKSLLFFLSSLYLGLELGKMFAKLLQSYLLQKVGQEIMQDLRSNLFARLIRMPMPFYDKNPTGRLITRITNDTANLMEIFGPGFVTLTADLLIISGVLIAMVTLNWKLGLISASVFPLMMFAMNLFANKLRVSYREARFSLASLNAFFAERMAGMPVVQMMAMENYEQERFNCLSRDYYEKQMGSVNVFAYFHPCITILSALSIALVLYFGGIFVAQHNIPMGVFVSFLAYVQVLFQPIRSLTEKYNIYQNAMSSAERIFSLLKLEEEEGLRLEQRSEARLAGRICFNQVSFSYDARPEIAQEQKRWALKNANFEILPNERIAVVGHTGAGKSTLLSLLFRFYDPQIGSIAIDGQNIQNYSKNFLRRRLGFVQQDVFIFAGTIRENLLLLGENISEPQMLVAAKATGLDRIVSKLSEGYETKLDERGTNLSLGERQVLAITRVLLQEPDILILDEATSHVDTNTEILLQKAMDEVTKNRTSIIIAHRLSTIRNADRIFVFEKGEMIESGAHSELLARRGSYYHFMVSQH